MKHSEFNDRVPSSSLPRYGTCIAIRAIKRSEYSNHITETDSTTTGALLPARFVHCKIDDRIFLSGSFRHSDGERGEQGEIQGDTAACARRKLSQSQVPSG
jgi:hypothetical protein